MELRANMFAKWLNVRVGKTQLIVNGYRSKHDRLFIWNNNNNTVILLESRSTGTSRVITIHRPYIW